MLPDRVSNPGPLTYESGALPIALRGPADAYADSDTETGIITTVLLVLSYMVGRKSNFSNFKNSGISYYLYLYNIPGISDCCGTRILVLHRLFQQCVYLVLNLEINYDITVEL